MNGFRLYNISAISKSTKTINVKLIRPNIENGQTDNYYTLLIGNNGTGKSIILSKIARKFIEIHNKENLTNENSSKNDEVKLSYNKIPQSIIALTTSISDKFPVDRSSAKSNKGIKDFNYKDLKYNYIGPKIRTNFFSNKVLINKAIDILLENYSKLDISRIYRIVFDYLDYDPILKIRYKVDSKIFNLSNDEITPEILRGYITDTFQKYSNPYIKSRIKAISEVAEILCKQINESSDTDEFEAIIDFSIKNINKINNNRLQFDSFKFYEVLGFLKRLGIIIGFDVTVRKKDGSVFSFSEASSGEANILTTFISLIPLLKNDSLILIDEPEISLHPSWQLKYFQLLNKIFENFSGCHIIMASHSHFIVSDLNIENSTIITLENNKGIIKSRFEDSAYGCSAESILLNVFKLPTIRNYYLYNEVSKALELLADYEKSEIELNEILMKLRLLYPQINNNDPIKVIINSLLED